jgi:polyphosphate kinase
MDRNLWRRIEIACPIRAPELKARILENLSLFLKDDAWAWVMDQNGGYARVAEKGSVSAQQTLLLANQSGGLSLP